MSSPSEQTRIFLERAGLKEGMTVLDLGCGSGAVSQLLHGLVGPAGKIIGIDTDEDSLNFARKSCEEKGMINVSFHNHNVLHSMEYLGEFDAVVGRRVLMYLPSVVTALKNIKAVLKPSGIFAFQEIRCIEEIQDSFHLHCHVRRLFIRTLLSEGASIHIDETLPAQLVESGFSDIKLTLEPNNFEQSMLGALTQVMLPRMLSCGISADEIGIETLCERLQAESNVAKANHIEYVSNSHVFVTATA